MRNTIRLGIRVVFYREGGEWVAHCLEFDLCGTGATIETALESLTVAIDMQLQFSLEHQDPRALFRQADAEIMERFARGRHIAQGTLALHLQRDNPADGWELTGEDFREAMPVEVGEPALA
jgi:predicted RNase H-like HicB family nuclease